MLHVLLLISSIPACLTNYWCTSKFSAINEGIIPRVVPAIRRKSSQESVVPDGRESSEDEGGCEMTAEP